jgi:signal transduction histidine kinase
MARLINRVQKWTRELVLSVPVGLKIIGISILPVLILGITLNFWVTSGLEDWLSYILTDVRVEAAMAAGSRSVTFVTVLAAFGSLFVALLFTHILTRPILELRKTAEKVASGEYQTRANVWARDEIGSLAISINQMIDNFVNFQEDLADTNRQLEAINQIGLAADRGLPIHDVLYIVLENLLELVDLQIGWVYLYDPDKGKFHLASWYNVPEDLENGLLSQDPGMICDCQQMILDNTLGDQVQKIPCRRMTACDCPGINSSHISIPITARDEYYGVINLLYSDSTDLPLDKIDLLNSVGSQVSEIVSNAWLQMKIKEKEAARQLLLESLVTAQESERSRLARELHDQSGQTLAHLLVRLKTLEGKIPEENLQEDLKSIQEIVSFSIDQLSEISYRLRPPALEEFGLGTALWALLEQMILESGLELEYSNNLTAELSQEISVVLFRIAQEALTNVLRHANAKRVSVRLENTGDRVTMVIEDDGVGFEPDQLSRKPSNRHLGLISMTERAEIVGGDLQVDTSRGDGTKLQIQVPFTNLETIR